MRLRSALHPLLVLSLVVPAGAPAATGLRWPSPTVTYRDKSSERTAVATAVAWWNAAPSAFSFVRAAKGARANVTVRSIDRPRTSWDGLARWRLSSRGRIASARLDLNEAYLSRDSPEYVAEVAAHELGHAIGLPHLSDRCSLMYPNGSVATRCPSGAGPGRYFCGPQGADVRSLIARYGGSLAGWPPTSCPGAPPRSTAAARAR